MTVPPAITEPPAITLQGCYSLGNVRLFGPLSMHLPAGQWSCLLGPSGVGKSTILRLILGLSTSGQFEGSVQADDGLPLRDRISYMAQSDLLLPWLTVLENTVLGARLRGETPDLPRARQLLTRVGLEAYQSMTPAALSGGMRQRAALARALIEDRPVVLLDEPFSALDAGTRADMQELAAEVLRFDLWVMAGVTVLLIPIMLSGWRISRLEGGLFLALDHLLPHLVGDPIAEVEGVAGFLNDACDLLCAESKAVEARPELLLVERLVVDIREVIKGEAFVVFEFQVLAGHSSQHLPAGQIAQVPRIGVGEEALRTFSGKRLQALYVFGGYRGESGFW